MEKKRVLIVYYSRTGNTKKVINSVAKELSCDVEGLIDLKNRQGIWGFVRSSIDAVFRRKTVLQKPKFSPGDYEIVILGTPIWAGTMSSAIRTYILDHRNKLDHVAFIITKGSSSNKRVVEELKILCEKAPLAIGDLKEELIKNNGYKEETDKFVQTIKKY